MLLHRIEWVKMVCCVGCSNFSSGHSNPDVTFLQKQWRANISTRKLRELTVLTTYARNELLERMDSRKRKIFLLLGDRRRGVLLTTLIPIIKILLLLREALRNVSLAAQPNDGFICVNSNSLLLECSAV
mmetsp:Transcript_2391/g.5528  ORF Transcript_2391/g.5528 Transcript_2391/m.5528 type:complete len:129 (+) Transcript_2391:611-997(+)